MPGRRLRSSAARSDRLAKGEPRRPPMVVDQCSLDAGEGGGEGANLLA